MRLEPGTRLGPYEVLAPLGAGGMGEVYRARDTRLNRTVAIKILPAHLATAPGFRERFEREARTISAVEHPHICALYDIGTERLRPPLRQVQDDQSASAEARDGGQRRSASADESRVDFLVMQYVDGETLADRIRRDPIPVPEAVAIARQIAAGLEAAHDRGILHRDLKLRTSSWRPTEK
jgi:serine/threonine protein kinase